MLGRPIIFRPDMLRDHLRSGGNLLFALFVAAVLALTLLAATHRPDDPLLHPSSSSLTSFLTSTSNSTFLSDNSLLRTGEDFNSSSPVGSDSAFIKLSDVAEPTVSATSEAICDPGSPISCAADDRELYNLLMRTAIEALPDIHIYRFGRPAEAGDGLSCDLAWRFRPKDDARDTFYKDYRRFTLSRAANCSLSVSKIGDFHSGVNVRKKRRAKKESSDMPEAPAVVGEAVNDTLPVVASESDFSHGKYLIYMGGGERCKSMNHYIWGFLCALGEAKHLNRTLVMDLKICLSSLYTGTGMDAEGKDFRFYFDFEHLRDSASVIDQSQFWTDWGKWHQKHGLKLYYVDDFRVTPMKLAEVNDALIMRKFGDVEPDNYWYRVCEGETESVIQRPWNLIWKSRRLMEIVSAVASRMNWDFDSVHVVRGEKAKNTELWPNLSRDTSPDALLTSLSDKVEEGRHLYIATNEPDTSFFDPLKDKYQIHFFEDFKDLWDENSEWYAETKELNNGVPVEFDGYMRVEVDTEVFLRGKKQIETFNDLTRDCKDGVNTCPSSF
ncbi:uncharacterized protein [Typha angustifolia]|uniref:uncharacterized protein n=1 Tax=Typha angustifolia TaxID=59011 RepID=UPI003C2B08BE